MKVCPCCKYRDNPYWRHSRFDYDADYMRFEDFITEYPELAMILFRRANHHPILSDGYIYYRRGTDGIEVYRVWAEDYRMPRERKNHKVTS